MPLRVLIVDDHPLHTMGLKVVLEENAEVRVVGLATTGAEAVRMALDLRPDVVVMDVRLPDFDGIEATRRIKHQAPEIAILGLSGFDDDDKVIGMIRAGVSGYVLKDAPFSEIVEAIGVVSRGQTYYSPRVVRAAFWLLHRRGSTSKLAKEFELMLTRREREVLDHLIQGLSNQEIADTLVISKRTVENHIRNLFHKLGVRTRSQALLQAFQLGLIKPNMRQIG